MEVTPFDRRLRDIQREYFDFLSDGGERNKYTQLVKNLMADKGRRLIVNLNDLRERNPERAKNLLINSTEERIAFQRALKEYVSNVCAECENPSGDFFVGFDGSFGNRHVTPRSLPLRFMGNLVCVEGIVTKCSIINLKLVRSVHYCSVTKKVTEMKHADLTSLEAIPTRSVCPTKDEDGNPLETEFGLSTYIDHQTISIQEMPEKAPAGQLPISVDVVCADDLVDRCKPGDRILAVGSYRYLPNQRGSFTSGGTFRAVIIASNISRLRLSKDAGPSLSRADVELCKRLAKKEKDIFSLLARSIAPSIRGHDYIKKAILCLLLGGEEKILPNGTRLRGDINVLLVGDPSVAKSQFLRYVLATAPRAILTSGRGSTGVGLTAAVTTDRDTRERRLEAGAMVLGDRGVVCIDEFDKMSDIDRTAIHEVMEQGRVTIAKAGIHASLNARCSVLAAADPVYGKYDQHKTPMENINLQDSLLSRFDLSFLMLDNVNEEIYSVISDYVVRLHRYRNPLEQDGEVLPMGSGADRYSTQNPDAVDEEDSETTIYEKYDPLLHGNRREWQKKLSVEFVRKYIHFVKIIKPKLTEEAGNIIARQYSILRSRDTMEDGNVARTQPVTARTLETLIRLATAHAKARISPQIKEEDARAAIELVQYAYFKEVLEKPNRKRTTEYYEDEIADDESGSQRRSTRVIVDRRQSVAGSQHSDVVEPSNPSNIRNGTNDGHHLPEETVEVADSPAIISDSRLSIFKTGLLHLFGTGRTRSLHLRNLIDRINEGRTDPFTQNEVTAAIRQMSDDNQVMLADEVVILI